MLDTCPQCGYSLRGLPADHCCPECGLAYDASSEIFKRRNPWALLGVIAAAGFAGTCLVFLAAQRMRLVAGKLWLVFYATIYGVIFIRASRRYWRNYRHGSMVATMPDALWLTLGTNGDERMAWGDISRVVIGRGFLGATLFLKETRSVRDIRGVFNKRADAARFVSQVEARIAHATPAD